MTAIDSRNFEYDTLESTSRSRTFSWAAVFSCLFIAAMFMLATNDLQASSKWESTTREQVSNLSITLESGRMARQIAFLSLGAWGGFMVFLSRRSFRFDGVFLFPLVVLIGWAFLSILWSGDRSFTGKRLILLGCVASAVIAFVRCFKLRDLALLALIGGTLQLLGSVIFDVLSASGNYGRSGYRFSGLQHPNHSGITAVFLIFGCLYFFERTRLLRYLVLLAASAMILYLTKSRTSLIACMCGVGVFALLRWQRRTVALLALSGLVAMGAFFTLVAMDVIANDWSNVIHMGREDSQAAAFTGRPFIWAAALEWLGNQSSRLLLGVGYDSFWTPEAAMYVSNRVWFRISEGHCAYFDTLLELGIVGVSCYVFLVLGSWIRYLRLASVRRSAAYAFAAMIFTFVCIHGLTESTTVDPNFPTFFSFTAMSFLALRAPRLRDEETEVPT